MKKVLGILFCFFAVLPTVTVAQDTKYVWHLGAVSDVFRELYIEHCPVGIDELVKMSNFVKENRVRSIQEMADKCTESIEITSELVKGSTVDGICTGTSKGDGCEYFINRLIEEQNKVVKIFEHPGTYVTKVQGMDDVYQINNVIPGGKDIWLLSDDMKSVVDLGIDVRTEDMFINIDSREDVRGVYNRSYIYTKVDLSDWIYQEYDSWDRGVPIIYGAATAYAGLPKTKVPNFAPEPRYDIKNRDFFDQYRIDGQTDIDVHTNGFLFQGQIVHLEWLGHFIIGMTQEETLVPKAVSDFAMDVLQKGTNDVQGQGDTDPKHFLESRSQGINYQYILSKFSKTQTSSPMEAIQMVEYWARETKQWESVECIDKDYDCDWRPATQDFIDCYFDGVLYKMEFDDICD